MTPEEEKVKAIHDGLIQLGICEWSREDQNLPHSERTFRVSAPALAEFLKLYRKNTGKDFLDDGEIDDDITNFCAADVIRNRAPELVETNLKTACEYAMALSFVLKWKRERIFGRALKIGCVEMRDFKLKVEVEIHSKYNVTDAEIELMKEGLKQLLTGSWAKGYTKTVRVEVEKL